MKRKKKIKRSMLFFVVAHDGAYEFSESDRGKAISLYDEYKSCGEMVGMYWMYKGNGYTNLLMRFVP